MARSDTVTLLPLDVYARLMGISPCAFNQVYNPLESYPTDCNEVWLQSATGGQRFVGRDEIATAVRLAEEMIEKALGFAPAPRYYVRDSVEFPWPRRGQYTIVPELLVSNGYPLEFGTEDTETLIADNRAVVYSDRDGDGIPDTATITIVQAEMEAAEATWNQIAVYYPETYLDWSPRPRDETWRIRPLQISVNPATGDVTLTGHRCQFVRPDLWDTDAPIPQDVDANFVSYVDIYRRYTNPEHQAQYIYPAYLDNSSQATCAETCQSACVRIYEARIGRVRAYPAIYYAGEWQRVGFPDCRAPDRVEFNYLAGHYRSIAGWMEADLIDLVKPNVAEAIVRLANTYLPEAPCSCARTQQRWLRDREEQEINNQDTALAMSAFGSTMRGAIFAWSIVKRLNPLSLSGAL